MQLSDHLHKLGYFIHVVEAGSIKQGSARAYLSQPQMTRVIQQLEESVGASLFVRSKSGVVVTKAGADLYDLATKILKDVDSFLYTVKNTLPPSRGEVRVGTYDSIARYFFPDFLNYFESRNPNFNVYLETGRSADIAKKVKNKTLDIGVIVNANEFKFLDNHLAYKDGFGLYVSVAIKKTNMNKLVYFDFAQNDVRSSIKRFKFINTACCDNLETVKILTETGVGVGLLPHRVARDGVMTGQLEPYRHPKIHSDYFDEHSVDICFSPKKSGESFEFFKDELLRYLKLWAKK